MARKANKPQQSTQLCKAVEEDPRDTIRQAILRLDVINEMLWDETGLPVINLKNEDMCSGVYWSINSICRDINGALELLQAEQQP
jgi:hypothetical protein